MIKVTDLTSLQKEWIPNHVVLSHIMKKANRMLKIDKRHNLIKDRGIYLKLAWDGFRIH